MIGDKLLSFNENDSATEIYELFGLNWHNTGIKALTENVKRLVELNNEVYERYHQKWVEGYNQRIQDEQEEKV
jgi:hypothetical protein